MLIKFSQRFHNSMLIYTQHHKECKMKNFIKGVCLALVLLFAPMFVGCGAKSVVSIVKTGTNGNVDTYTITYSDNTTSTMEVNNGQKTILDIKKTSTVGNKDIYTITYSDNTSTTFEVTNGKDGIDGLNGKDGTIITVTSLYEEWKKGLEANQDDSFDAFLKQYLTFETPNTLVKTISETINCAVSINTVFNYKRQSLFKGETT